MKKLVNVVLLLSAIIVVLFIEGCKSEAKFEIDTSAIKLELKLVRMDRLMFEMPLPESDSLIPILVHENQSFFIAYSNHVLELGNPQAAAYSNLLYPFITDYTLNTVYVELKKQFANFSPEMLALQNAFTRFAYYYPNTAIPVVYTCMSGFNQSVFTADNTLAIALDNYLGAESDFYNRLEVENYRKRKMHRGKIVADAVQAWLMRSFDYNDAVDDLAAEMIYHGKIQYATDALLPKVPDSIKYGYTPAQLAWAQEYEEKSWSHFVESKVLFSQKRLEKAGFINDGPFTSVFSKNSAPRMGVYIGRQIVASFMKHNTEYTMQMLMEEDDYRMIMNLSRYNP